MTKVVEKEKKMIRIAHIYDSKCGRNDGAPLYTLEALKRLKEKVEVYHYLPKGDPAQWGKFDLYWWVDFADDALGYQDFPMPKDTFYWSSDYHINKDSYAYRLKRAKQARWVACYQKRNVEEFIGDGIPKDRIFWLPPAFEPTCYRPGVWSSESDKWIDAVANKEYDLCFIGHVNNQKREDALDHMFKAIPNFFYGVRRFERCATMFSRSKVVFNTAHADDINMRVFEVLGSRNFLLTEDIPTIHELFEDGKHLVTYKNLDDAVDKARYYIEHDDERERIALNGWLEVNARHTYDHRIQTVLDRTGG